MSRTYTATELSFERGLYDSRTHGLRDNTDSGAAPWRFLWHSGDGTVEAWVALPGTHGGTYNGTWAFITTIPPDTPLEVVEQALRAMAMLGMDTGV